MKAAAFRERLEMGQGAFVHPALRQRRVHAVEAEDDQSVLDTRCRGVAGCKQRAGDAGGGQ